MFSDKRANGKNQRRRVCFVEFAKWRHRGQSLPSPTASRFRSVLCTQVTQRAAMLSNLKLLRPGLEPRALQGRVRIREVLTCGKQHGRVWQLLIR